MLFTKMLISLCLLLAVMTMLACGTMAVKGTPVKELVATKPELEEMKNDPCYVPDITEYITLLQGVVMTETKYLKSK